MVIYTLYHGWLKGELREACVKTVQLDTGIFFFFFLFADIKALALDGLPKLLSSFEFHEMVYQWRVCFPAHRTLPEPLGLQMFSENFSRVPMDSRQGWATVVSSELGGSLKSALENSPYYTVDCCDPRMALLKTSEAGCSRCGNIVPWGGEQPTTCNYFLWSWITLTRSRLTHTSPQLGM